VKRSGSLLFRGIEKKPQQSPIRKAAPEENLTTSARQESGCGVTSKDDFLFAGCEQVTHQSVSASLHDDLTYYAAESFGGIV